MRVLAALLFWFGCSELPTVERGVCGNMVLEKGEHCDTFSPFGGDTACGAPESEHACAYVCGEENACPGGWACGHDGRCRLPDRRFSERQVEPFRSLDVIAGDADGDGMLDLLGNDRSQLSVLHQIAPRMFGQDFLIETRLPIGAPFFGDLDGDRRTDVIVPTLLGLSILLGQDDRTLLSRVYDTAIGVEGAARFVVTGDRSRPLGPGDVSIVVGSAIASLDSGLGTELPAWLDPRALPKRIPFGRFAGGDRSTFLLWNAGGTQIALFRVEGTNAADRRPILKETLATTVPLGDTIEPADVDGNGTLDLVASIASERPRIAIARSSTTSFAPFCELSFEIYSNELERWIPFEAQLLRAADFDGDRIADYVFDAGVLTSAGVVPDCGAPNRSARISALTLLERWREVELGDFNGDGRLDFAAASDERQLDVYFGSGTGGFARRTVLLDHAPVLLRAGDFDGDFVDDVAMVFDQQTDLVSVLFGDPGSELKEPQPMGRFAHVTDAIAAHWAFDVESLDLVSDLLIQSHPFDSEELSVAIAYGSTSRQMFAPFVFPDSVTGPPLGAVAGRFCNCTEPGCTEAPDVVAISRTLTPPRTELWLARGVPGEPRGRLDPSATPIELQLDTASFDFSCAVWHVANTDGDPRDEVFALDGAAFCGRSSNTASRLLLIDPNDGACDRRFAIDVRPIEENSYGGATRIRSADLDADGDLDLLLVFAGRMGLGHGVVLLFNDEGRFERTRTIDAPPGTATIDADAIQLDQDAPLELALRTYDAEGRSAVWFFEDDYGAPLLFHREPAPPGAIVATDLDGDGLEDLAITSAGRVTLIWAEDGAR